MKTNLTGVPYSLLLPLFHFQIFFSLSSFAAHSTIRTPGTGYVSASEGERSRFRHISVITFPFFLVSVTFQVTNFFSFFLTHVQDRMINVSEILPLRPIKVNNGKFYLLLRSGYFVNGCVFTRVYVICKICEKLRGIHSCRRLRAVSLFSVVRRAKRETRKWPRA